MSDTQQYINGHKSIFTQQEHSSAVMKPIDEYRYSEGSIAGQELRTEHEIEKDIGSVRGAFEKLFTKRATVLANAELDLSGSKLDLYHSSGSRYMDNDYSVMEFNIGGSSFRMPRNEQRGIHGKGEYSYKENEEDVAKARKFFRKLLPECRLRRHLDRSIQEALVKNRAAKQKIQQDYGSSVTIDGKSMKYVRRKDITVGTATKTKISMAGPLGMGGAANTGEYDIEHLRSYIYKMGTDFLAAQLPMTNGVFQVPDKPIYLQFKGHSRGAVAVGQGARMIKGWINRLCPQCADMIRLNVILYDPVPGAITSNRAEMDKSDFRKAEKLGDGMDLGAFSDNDDVTVFYSMRTEHAIGFDPQTIDGADRVIMLPTEHSVNLKNVDTSQVGETRQVAYKDLTGDGDASDRHQPRVYRGTGISELRKGVYIVDEKNVLIRMESDDDTVKMVDQVDQKTGTQIGRELILKKVVKKWFDDNP